MKKKQKKDNALSAIIVILVIALVMMIVSIVYEEAINMQNEPAQNTGAGLENEKENETTEDDEENSLPDEDEENQDEETVDEENPVNDEEPVEEKQEPVGEEEKDTQNTQDTAKSIEEKVINLAKKEWGNDDSVTFSIVDKNGSKYRVAVRGSETETLTWYEVNTETWEISEY